MLTGRQRFWDSALSLSYSLIGPPPHPLHSPVFTAIIWETPLSVITPYLHQPEPHHQLSLISQHVSAEGTHKPLDWTQVHPEDVEKQVEKTGGKTGS